MKLIDIQELNELYTNFGKLEILCTYLYILNLEQWSLPYPKLL